MSKLFYGWLDETINDKVQIWKTQTGRHIRINKLTSSYECPSNYVFIGFVYDNGFLKIEDDKDEIYVLNNDCKTVNKTVTAEDIKPQMKKRLSVKMRLIKSASFLK
jgi:hypothetical protein